MKEYHYIRVGQPGSELFTFVMPASDLIELAKVDRFNENDKGVERKLNYGHVLKLVEFMRQPNASFAEPILGDLRGPCRFDEKRQVVSVNKDCQLHIDEGQHRIAAFHLLAPKEREQWKELMVTATINTPYQERLRRFTQQLKRLKLDTHLVLQIQERGDLFTDPISKATYGVAKRLATESDSPLCGLIRLEERPPRKLPSGRDAEILKPFIGNMGTVEFLRESTVGIINVGGVLRDLRLAISSVHSVIRSHNTEQQYRLIVALLDTAKALWPEAWSDPKKFFLRRADGIGALLQLFSGGKDFKDCLRKSFKDSLLVLKPETKDELVRTLAYAKSYDWSFERFRRPGMKFPKPGEITRELDALIYQKRPRAGAAGKHQPRAASR